MDRDETIQSVRVALRRRTGRAWSVTGGRGTARGWIKVDAPPARRTWRYRPREGFTANTAPPGDAGWEEYDSGAPGGHMSPADRAALARALGLDRAHHQGVQIPASSDHYREYVERAQGRPVTKHAQPYWD